MRMDPESELILQKIVDDQGKARQNKKVAVSYLSNAGQKHGWLSTGYGANEDKIGPELAFGTFMQESVDEPILIIKAAWGGKSLHTDFRPPSAEAYEFYAEQIANFNKQGKDVAEIKQKKLNETGHYYNLMIQHVKDTLANLTQLHPDLDTPNGTELAGFVWFQGWNDMVDRGTYPNRDGIGGYKQYSAVMAKFIRDVRRDLSAPNMPFVIGVLGVGGPVSEYPAEKERYATVHQNFRNAMAAPAKTAEFADTVAAVLTENCWDNELSSLQARDTKLRQSQKQLTRERGWDRKASETWLEEQRVRTFDERELKVLQTGISNFEFHYLGSAKIMTRIGRDFASAMNKLIDKE